MLLIAPAMISAIWLFLLLYGIRAHLLPSEKLVRSISLLRAEAVVKSRAQAASASKGSLNKKTTKNVDRTKMPSKLIYGPSYSLYAVAQLEKRALSFLHMLHSYLLQLHRYQWSFEHTVYVFNEALGQAILVVLVGSWLAYATKELAVAGIAAVIAIVLVLNVLQQAKTSIDQRRKAMLMELPKLLTRLTLLVGAGESVLQSFIKCVQHKSGIEHPLYVEWNEAVHELQNGISFSTVIEKLNRNCALQQMSLLTTILLLNFQKGGEHFISSVQELNLSLWDTRKTMARTKGEEASAKIIFPLVGILLLVMVLIVAPAVFMMQSL